MKRTLKNLLWLVALVGVVSCSKENLQFDKPDSEEEAPGLLTIGGVSVNVDVETSVVGSVPQELSEAVTRSLTGGTYDYLISVIDVKTELPVQVTDVTTQQTLDTEFRYGDLFSENTSESGTTTVTAHQVSIRPGTYRLYAHAAGTVAGAAENAPYYAGTSEDFEIKSDVETSASVTCKLANIKTTVELSADLKKLFLDTTDETRLKTVVTVGENSYTFEKGATHSAPLVYFRDEAGLGNDNEMTILVSGKYYTGSPEDLEDGGTADTEKYQEVKMTKKLSDVRAGQWRKISIDAQHNTTGNVIFIFTIENYVYDDEISVDVATLYANVEEEIEDGDEEISDVNAPEVAFSDGTTSYTIDASQYNEDSDTWQVPTIKVSPVGDASVESYYAVIGSDNADLLAAIAARFPASRAADAEYRIALFPDNDLSEYCTAKETEITIKQGGMNKLFGYAGTHTVKIVATDNQSRKSYTTLTINVASGSSTSEGPTVVWENGNIDERFTLNAENATTTSCRILLTSSTGLTGLTADIVSDVLTDEELAGVGLAAHIDLMNPGDMADGLKSLGLLSDEGYAGQRNAVFDITNFLSLLHGVYSQSGECDFILKATDAGGTTEKTVMFYVEK